MVCNSDLFRPSNNANAIVGLEAATQVLDILGFLALRSDGKSCPSRRSLH